ncbi:MAG: hypothetical protein KatS3mg101_0351 [Patescibacteria group bacterium]|nr:MAG: hypothetical protein KatS3mg101_0351 [Patescibacteria group bacterium]
MIIVNYATKGLIEKNISNLLESYENCEIIFVDNDSPDGSRRPGTRKVRK